MKKLLLISMLIGAMSLPALAQVDDLYYVPKKKTVEKVTDNYGMPKDTYYSGSDRSVDDYNRRESSYEVIGDSLKSDVIDLTAEQGVYPDSLEDFQLTKKMTRFDDYELSDNAAFWAGYAAGRYDWGWHSPWYYSRFGWYGGWYDPWYSPWYYRSWYGLYDPWYYGNYGWYGGWYGGWHDPWYYGYGWSYPYHWNGWAHSYIGVGRNYTSTHIGTGTIRRDGSTHTTYVGGRNGAVAGNSNRMNSINKRAERLGGRRNNSGNNYNGYRGNNNSSSRSSNSSFSGTRSSSSSSGSFSGGGGGSSRSSGGGGGRSGGRR